MNRQSNARKTVVVVGMHRSGTSLISRMLEAGGVYFGAEEDLARAADDNPRGFWEHTGIRAINEELLERLDANWRNPPVSPERHLENPSYDDLRERAREVIRDLGERAPLCGWKDPRTTLLLPFWRSLITSDLSAVFCLRHPRAVTASLERRDGMPTALALFLWQEYCARAVSNLADLPVVVVSYEEVLRDPVGQAHRLARAVSGDGATLDPAPMARAVEPELAHHHPPTDPELGAGGWDGGEQLYVELSECSRDTRTWRLVQPRPPPRDDTFVCLMRDSARLAARLSVLENVHAHRHREAASLEELAQTLDAELGSTKAALAEARAQSAETTNVLAQREAERTGLVESMQVLEAELGGTKAALDEVPKQLEALRNELEATRADLHEAERRRRAGAEEISQLKNALQRVFESKGFRALERLRAFKRWLRGSVRA